MARTLSRLGQINKADSVDALFLKKFAGETLKAFRRKTKFMPRHVVRTIENGKSASFPVMGRAAAQYHTPGNEITGGQIAHSERVITIDDLLIVPLAIYELDEAKNHYPVRSEYTFQAGEELANRLDRTVAQVGYLAARDSATITGMPGGTQIPLAMSGTDGEMTADDLVAALFEAAQTLDENDVPESERYAFVTPAEYNLLIHSSNKAIHRDFGGEGSIARGVITEVAGLEIVKTNNLPNGNDIDSGPEKYQGDFTDSVSLVMHRSAVGTVQLMNLTTEISWEIQYQSWLIVAKLAVGHGILRPEAAVEIHKPAEEQNGGGD